MPKKLTIEHMNGTTTVRRNCSRVHVEDGVLKAFVEDTSYTGHTEGFPLANIQSYRVEER